MTVGELEVQIVAIADEASRVRSFTLAPVGSRHLPTCGPGSHIDCHLPAGMVRSYSLLNAGDATAYYMIGVAKERNSRGGSRHIHEKWSVGDIVKISLPRNNFRLAEDADYSVFIAGGIGITPLVSMVAR
ncbi:ferredoxin reductase, partial [Pseudorhodoplanes sp.]|uniref:ferredoxin reductase n=1 Tax=Pseudorhodoplanes sp. TaxID=1934341 RepID=UPI003D1363AA